MKQKLPLTSALCISLIFSSNHASATIPMCHLSPQEQVSRSKVIVEAAPIETKTIWIRPLCVEKPNIWKNNQGLVIRFTKYKVFRQFKGKEPWKTFWVQSRCVFGKPSLVMPHRLGSLRGYCQYSQLGRSIGQITRKHPLAKGKPVLQKIHGRKRLMFLGERQKDSPKGKRVVRQVTQAAYHCKSFEPSFWPNDDNKKIQLLKKLLKK